MSGDLNIESIIDRILQITEKTTIMQEKFLRELYELRTALNQTGLTDVELRKDVEQVLQNTFDIYNKMKLHSNEALADEIKVLKETIIEIHSYCKKNCEHFETLEEGIKTIDKKDMWFKIFMASITGLITLFLTLFGIWNHTLKDNMKKDLIKVIQEEVQ